MQANQLFERLTGGSGPNASPPSGGKDCRAVSETAGAVSFEGTLQALGSGSAVESPSAGRVVRRDSSVATGKGGRILDRKDEETEVICYRGQLDPSFALLVKTQLPGDIDSQLGASHADKPLDSISAMIVLDDRLIALDGGGNPAWNLQPKSIPSLSPTPDADTSSGSGSGHNSVVESGWPMLDSASANAATDPFALRVSAELAIPVLQDGVAQGSAIRSDVVASAVSPPNGSTRPSGAESSQERHVTGGLEIGAAGSTQVGVPEIADGFILRASLDGPEAKPISESGRQPEVVAPLFGRFSIKFAQTEEPGKISIPPKADRGSTAASSTRRITFDALGLASSVTPLTEETLSAEAHHVANSNAAGSGSSPVLVLKGSDAGSFLSVENGGEPGLAAPRFGLIAEADPSSALPTVMNNSEPWGEARSRDAVDVLKAESVSIGLGTDSGAGMAGFSPGETSQGQWKTNFRGVSADTPNDRMRSFLTTTAVVSGHAGDLDADSTRLGAVTSDRRVETPPIDGLPLASPETQAASELFVRHGRDSTGAAELPSGSPEKATFPVAAQHVPLRWSLEVVGEWLQPSTGFDKNALDPWSRGGRAHPAAAISWSTSPEPDSAADPKKQGAAGTMTSVPGKSPYAAVPSVPAGQVGEWPGVLSLKGVTDERNSPEADLAGPATEATFHASGETRQAATALRHPAAETALFRHVSQQIADVARRLPERPVELTLDPQELGRVRMTLSAHDGAMTVSLAIERGETADLMRRHIETLAQDFRQIGFRSVSFEFAGGGGGAMGAGAGGSPAAPPAPSDGPADLACPEEIRAPEPVRIRLSERVDIRL